MAKICCVCGNTNFVQVNSVKMHTLVECSACQLQLLEPAPDVDQLKNIYSGDYYDVWDSEGARHVAEMKQITFRNYLNEILKYGNVGTLLDVGCARGELMEVAREMGFDSYGVEVCLSGALACEEKFGKEKIISSQLKPPDFPNSFFDVITLFDVFEHMSDPNHFLRMAADFLKPKGLLMIVTPDTLSWTRKVMGKSWPHYKAEHVYYYNRTNISKLIAPLFEIISLGKARKSLTLNYLANVLNKYTENGAYRAISAICKQLPKKIRMQPFQVCIGEMSILCRKKL